MKGISTTLLCSVASILVIGPAYGQTQTTDTTAQQSTGSTTEATAAAPDSSQDIIVTASRREQSLLTVPSQITALTGDVLTKRNTRSLDEFVGFVPGLNVQSATPGSNLIVVRGVTTGSQSTNAVGAYLDDVPLNSSNGFAGGYRQLSVNVFDLDRVEVLSGPQGTLYGASSLGGTIRYITSKPQLDRGAARLEGEVSTTKHGGTNTGGRGMINMPLVQDKLALRADFVQQYDSGFIDNPVLGLNNQGDGRTIAVRASLLAKPSDRLDIQITGYTQKVENEGINAADRNSLTGARVPGQNDYQQTYQLPISVEQSAKVAYGTINYNADFATLTSITSYQTADFSTATDISKAYSGLFANVVRLGAAGISRYQNNTAIGLKKFTQEGRIVSSPGRIFDYVIGGYYTNERANTFTNIRNVNDPNGYIIGLPIFAATIPTRYREIAGYVNATIHITPRFDITGGFRYSHNSQTFTETLSGLFGNAANPFGRRQIGASSKENVKTYLVNPQYRITDQISIYARVANGFRPGGPNYALPGSTQIPRYGADTLTTYEVGTKAALFDKRLQATLSVYDTEWKKIQLSTLISGLTQLTNAGDARVRGADLTLGLRAGRSLTLSSSVSYTDAKLKDPSPILGITYSGARLPVTPRWAFAVGADYVADIGNGRQARLSVTDRYQGTRYSGIVGSTSLLPYKLDPFNIVDVNLAVDINALLEIGIYAKNITDSRGELFGSRTDNLYAPTAAANVALTRPRTIGIQGRFRL